VNAAYEVLSNDTARREYDLTGRIPPNAALGSSSPAPSSASSSSSGQVPPFFTPFPSQPFGFGPESFFNDHFDRFGSNFNHPFFNSGFPRSWDPFANDPFFNPRAARRSHRGPEISTQHLFREVEDMLQDFVRQTPSSAFGGRMHGNSLFDPPPFPSFFRPMTQTTQHMSFPQSQSNNGRPSESSSFFSSSRSTLRNGRWVSESYEETNVNGERKTRRAWMDDDVSGSWRGY
jgi:curved DNA-binding protein CbpA